MTLTQTGVTDEDADRILNPNRIIDSSAERREGNRFWGMVIIVGIICAIVSRHLIYKHILNK